MNLPDAPEGLSKKPNPVVRIGIAVVVALAVGVGIYFFPKSPSPDEMVTALTARVASDVVLVVSGQDKDGSAARRVEMAVNAFEKASPGCEVLGGTAALGNTAKGAAEHADRLIAEARTATDSDTEYEYGFGYTVVRGVEATTIQGRKAILPAPYLAVLGAIRCGGTTPSAPGFGS